MLPCAACCREPALAEALAWWSSEVPSKPYNSVILWFWDDRVTKRVGNCLKNTKVKQIVTVAVISVTMGREPSRSTWDWIPSQPLFRTEAATKTRQKISDMFILSGFQLIESYWLYAFDFWNNCHRCYKVGKRQQFWPMALVSQFTALYTQRIAIDFKVHGQIFRDCWHFLWKLEVTKYFCSWKKNMKNVDILLSFGMWIRISIHALYISIHVCNAYAVF